MTTPDAELNKALWLDKTAFWHLKKTEQDVDKLRAALPKEVKDSLILWDRAGAVTADLIYALTVHLNKEKEAGRSWPSRATRDQARECIKAAKELLHNINLAQTVASTVETVDAHGVRIDGLEEHVVEQKTFKEEQEKTNRWLQKEVDACVDGHKTTQLDVNDQRRAMDKVKHFVEGAIGQQSRMAETLENKFMTEEKERKELHCLTVKKAEAAAGLQQEVKMLAQLNDDNCKRLAASDDRRLTRREDLGCDV